MYRYLKRTSEREREKKRNLKKNNRFIFINKIRELNSEYILNVSNINVYVYLD